MNEKKKMKELPKRILSFVLTMAMVLTLMPGMSMEVKAASYPTCHCSDSSHFYHLYIYDIDESGKVSAYMYYGSGYMGAGVVDDFGGATAEIGKWYYASYSPGFNASSPCDMAAGSGTPERNISLDDSTENGYVFIKDPDDTGEYHPLDTDENVSIGSDKIKIYTVPAYGYKLDKITVSYGDNSTDYEDGCVVDLPQDKDVTIFASFEPISISVELSNHTKGLLKKLIELTGDSEEQAVETVSYYLADSDWTAYNSIEKMLSEGCQIPEEEFPKYIKAQFYMAFLEISFSLNGFALEENAGLDQLKCIINEIPTVVYKALDLCDSIRERDYENAIVLASEIEEDGLSAYNKVLGYEWDSEDALDERDFLNAVKNYLTDNAVSGDLFTNPKDASEKYAEYIAKLCGLTDSVSISKFKQYAVEWAIDEGNQYMLNYFGNLLSEEEFLDLTEEEKQNYVDKALTGMCLSMLSSFKWNHFAKDGEHFSANCSEEILWGDEATFVSLMRHSLDSLVAHKEAMINLIDICDLYYGKKVYDDYDDSEADYYDEDNKVTLEGAYHYINGYFNEILDDFSAELYTDWDNLYKTIQGENVVSSAFEVTDSDSGRTIKLLKDISFARLGQNPETLVIGEDNSIILDLNGHKINRNLKVATDNGRVIYVDGNLTVTDTSSSQNGMITGGNNTGLGGGVYVTPDGTFTMTGGNISGNAASSGAGIYAAGSIILGGKAKVKGNYSTDENATLNDLVLADGVFATIATDSQAPSTGMEIYVHGDLDEIIVASGAAERDAGYFKADDSTKAVIFDEGKLKIGIRKEEPKGHSPENNTPTTVPVTGEKETVKVEATVSGSTATVKDITEADLKKVSGGGNVEIDLSGLSKNIDSAKIPAATVEKIAEQSGMTVKLSTATVTFDRDASASITEQAQGETIELVVDDIKKDSLNTAQKEAVKDIKMAIVIDAYLVSGGARICSSDKGGFGKGEATVILPYDIKDSASKYSVYYIDDKGKLENLNARYDENLKSFVFKISHFSNYAIAYDESAVSSFVDVPSNAYYYDAVKWAAANGITAGIDDTHFGPSLGTTRAQVVTFLWRAAGSPEPAGNASKFADVKAGSYYEKAVAWAIENGITNGTAATSFSPESTCTRGQIVTFLYRFAGIDTSEVRDNPFIDVADGQFYHDAALWAAENGITTGISKNLFSPDSSCIRAQIVTFLYRYMGK